MTLLKSEPFGVSFAYFLVLLSIARYGCKIFRINHIHLTSPTTSFMSAKLFENRRIDGARVGKAGNAVFQLFKHDLGQK